MLLSLPVMAQEVIKLWPDKAIPNALPNAAATVTETTKTEGGILRISNVTVPTLTVYPATKKATSGAAIMICPGGGYSILASGHEGADVARWFNEQGITAFVLKYRLPDDRIMTKPAEVPLLDAMQGMVLIRQQAARFNIDPNKIGVIGFSAGGHLASTLSTHYYQGQGANEQARPNFAILLYPVVTFGEKAHAGSREKLLGKNASAAQVAYYSNELQVTKQTPVTFLVHSMDDNVVPVENSIDYYLALKKSNVPAEMHLYPTGGHGYALRITDKGSSVSGWPEACRGWLRSLGYIQ